MTNTLFKFLKTAFPYIILLISLFYSYNFQPKPTPNPGAMDPDTELQYEFPGSFRYYKSGRVERLDGTEVVPTGTDPTTGVISKDITINQSTGLSVRLYFPSGINSDKKVPIILFIHGGAFIIHTAGSPAYHRYCNLLSSNAESVVVSVSYRLAPEHRIPVAYDDTWESLKWVVLNCRSGSEPWLAKHGDLNRIFLAGDSAGANIAHNIAVRFAEEGIDGCPKLKGVLLLNPYFWGKDPIGNEKTDPGLQPWMEETWSFICGGKYDMNHKFVHPMGSPEVFNKLGCERVMVTVSELDLFVERGKAYAEALKKSGWDGKVVLYETPGENHVYFLTKFDEEKAVKEMEAMVAFINRD
ncbi:alpha/beta-Hydrolases superfamily protein [Rhynchospora pubera]|uniref:Alpha/beta-Hydrolases superfamily protein n=1 Tax=Rhynchospora pubera TaxID=906938 RepID=A0AAV8CZF9_9POAL|nr:alpha/beta-Hydrolases superfamily protein [Rhynchospora pubera]